MSSPELPLSPDPAPLPRACQNCAAPLAGPFCSQCGQHDVDYHRSFHHVFHDLLENLFHFEGKFFVTVAWLLAKPGRITREFLAGRRASQLNPLRFYIFVSVMFFLGLSLLNHGHLVDIPRKEVDRLQLDLVGAGSETRRDIADFTAAERLEYSRRLAAAEKQDPGHGDREAIAESIRRDRPMPAAGTAAPGVESRLPGTHLNTKVRVDRSTSLGRRLADRLSSGDLTVSDIWDALEHRVPTLLFLGVPLFALLLQGFYLRSGRFYVEHLIFSLHLHTWVFLVVMVANGYLKLAALGPSWLDNLCGWGVALWSAWYFFRSFRVVYEQSRARTATKIVLLGFVHVLALLAVAILLTIGTIAWLALE